MKFVYSTISSDMDYAFYGNLSDPNKLPVTEKIITIKGGAHVVGAVSKKPNALDCVVGVLTEISDADFELLQTNPVFQMHADAGYIKVVGKKIDSIEKAVSDMEEKDNSAQLTDDFYKDSDLKPKIDKINDNGNDNKYSGLDTNRGPGTKKFKKKDKEQAQELATEDPK